MRLRSGKIIPRDDGKRIEELVGLASTGTRSVSIAKMWAPPEWREPAQRPGFDEVVLVLSGALTLVIDGEAERIARGEVGLVPRGKRVVYRNDGRGACEYWSVCAPAFRPALARMEPALPARAESNEVALVIAHPRGARFEPLLRTEALRMMRALRLRRRELSLTLVADAAIRRLNRDWRRKDTATDVLSFPAGTQPRGVPAPQPLGDVVISLDTAARVARALEVPVEAELSRYLAHGLLHLLGHDHHRSADAARMRSLERRLLGEEGLIPHAGRSAQSRTARRGRRAAPD